MPSKFVKTDRSDLISRGGLLRALAELDDASVWEESARHHHESYPRSKHARYLLNEKEDQHSEVLRKWAPTLVSALLAQPIFGVWAQPKSRVSRTLCPTWILESVPYEAALKEALRLTEENSPLWRFYVKSMDARPEKPAKKAPEKTVWSRLMSKDLY